MVDLIASRHRGFASPRGRVVALATLLILGILGMHALAQHCAASAGAAGAAGTTGDTSSTPSMTTVIRAPAHSMTHESLDSELTAPVRGEEQGANGMTALCAVMLLAAVTALVVLLGFRRGWPRGWQVRRALASLARQVSAPSGTGPPYVVAFAVIRC